MTKKVLFFRNYKNFTGGHLKVWDYFCHIRSSQQFKPYIYFTPESHWDSDNPFLPIKHEILEKKDAIKPDVVFLAGLDWQQQNVFPQQVPVINFIQHVRHANPKTPLYKFLPNKAIRICVSQQVKQALVDSKVVNGPIFAIENGINVTDFPTPIDQKHKSTDVLILGLKNQPLATQLFQNIHGLKVKLINEKIPHIQFLNAINQSKICLFLPHITEGFYLPALEAMTLNSLVICPDCIGNRGFCTPNINCIQPVEYSLDELLRSLKSALSMNKTQFNFILKQAKITTRNHTLKRERQQFLKIMNEIDQIW